MPEVMELIKSRRTIRRFRPDPITDEQLNALLEAVRWAPSWANTQCWELVVVRSAETKEALQAAVGRNPAFEAMVEAPVVLVFCARKERAGFKKGEASTRYGDWFMYDLGLANQNLCLAAHAVGLGSVIVGRFDHDEVERICNVPDDRMAVAMVPIGIPAQDPKAPPRKELTEFVFDEGYPEA